MAKVGSRYNLRMTKRRLVTRMEINRSWAEEIGEMLREERASGRGYGNRKEELRVLEVANGIKAAVGLKKSDGIGGPVGIDVKKGQKDTVGSEVAKVKPSAIVHPLNIHRRKQPHLQTQERSYDSKNARQPNAASSSGRKPSGLSTRSPKMVTPGSMKQKISNPGTLTRIAYRCISSRGRNQSYLGDSSGPCHKTRNATANSCRSRIMVRPKKEEYDGTRNKPRVECLLDEDHAGYTALVNHDPRKKIQIQLPQEGVGHYDFTDGTLTVLEPGVHAHRQENFGVSKLCTLSLEAKTCKTMSRAGFNTVFVVVQGSVWVKTFEFHFGQNWTPYLERVLAPTGSHFTVPIGCMYSLENWGDEEVKLVTISLP